MYVCFDDISVWGSPKEVAELIRRLKPEPEVRYLDANSTFGTRDDNSTWWEDKKGL